MPSASSVYYYAGVVDYISGTVDWSLTWEEVLPGIIPYIDNTGLPQDRVGVVFTNPSFGGATGTVTVTARIDNVVVAGGITATITASSVTCEPYSVGIYPWATLPDVTELTTYYNDPTANGVSFNMNLGGYALSWENTTPGTVFTSVGLREPQIYVESGVYNSADSTVNLNIKDFTVTDPTQFARYAIVGGRSDGTYNPPAGHFMYPGVAALGAWRSGYLQAANYGYPILYEQWYSLNMSRNTPLVGYNNYTFFSDTLPNIVVNLCPTGLVEDAYVKKLVFGIFKATADLSNPLPDDFIMGTLYEGTIAGGTARLYTDGNVTGSLDVPWPVRDIRPEMNTFTDNTLAELVDKKSFISYNSVELYDGESLSETLENSWPWPATAPFTNGLIDTYQVKFGWYVDTYKGGLRQGRWSTGEVVYGNPIAMFALPDAILPCEPTSSQPDYIPALPLPPLPEPPLPEPPVVEPVYQWVPVMGPTYWSTSGLPWNGTAYASNSIMVGDGLYSTDNSVLKSATKVRVTYTNVGSTSPYIADINGTGMGSFFAQRANGTWADVTDINGWVINQGTWLSFDVGDTGLSSITVSNIEVYVLV